MFDIPQLNVLFTAMLPISELRGAIPLALGVYKMSVGTAYLLSVLGNIIPVIFLLWLLEPVSKFLMKHSAIFNKFFTWLFERTRRRHKAAIQKWGPIALVFFVAIPLPITGGWTGSVVAFVFGIPFKKALPLIFLGILIAGVVVTLASLGIIKII